MSGPTSDLVLELLRAIRADTADMRETLREHGSRLNRIEIMMASVRRDQANESEHVAHVEARVDRLNERVERIETRLELRDS